MFNKIIENIADLLKVKTIVTLLLTIIFSILALRGFIEATQFITIFTVIIGFYFGTQHQKEVENLKEAEKNEK